MKANELRIGNLVKNNESRYGDKILVIESIGDNDTVNVFFREYPINALEGIQLTEEWLFKFGFLKDLENDIFLNINAYAFLYWQNNRVELLDNDNNFMISHCDYVHQLQNLYFALTGKELTFKSE